MITKKTKRPILLCSIAFALLTNAVVSADESTWRIYSEAANGDVHFFDPSRVERKSALHTVWTRIRYKRNVMAASSYQSLLEIDCSNGTEQTLQRTFFTDRVWEVPAMMTDMKPKRKRPIRKGSAAERLSAILCGP